MAALLFFIGLVILLLSSKGVITNAVLLSRLTKIPPFIIGVTIVAIGTSLPEMVVSFFGGLDKASDLALGNILGSNIANIGIILGTALLLQPLHIGRFRTQKNMHITLLVGLVFFAMLMTDGISQFFGILLMLCGIGVIVWTVMQEKDTAFQDEEQIKNTRSPIVILLLLLIALCGLAFGGKLLVDNGVLLAQFLGVPEAVIGITAVAVGTSLPELAVTLMALSKHGSKNEEKLVMGNILGSNIFNILFGAGMLGVFGVRHFTNTFTLYVFLLFTLILAILVYSYKGRIIPRYFGAILFVGYIVYLLLLLL